MPAAALQAKVAAYLEAHRDQLDEHGRRLVVRNGYHAEREVISACMRAPVLAVGNGALELWKAIRDVFLETREQR